jgi:hypothetical protein
MKTYYVYEHIFTNGVRYIGKGTGVRYKVFTNRNTYWKRLQKKYGNPTVDIIIPNLTNQEAYFYERIVIQNFKLTNIPICNLTDGGLGANGQSNPNSLANLGYKGQRDTAIKCLETEQIYKTAKEAAKQTGINHSNIINTCRGYRKSAGGYTWTYVNGPNIPIKPQKVPTNKNKDKSKSTKNTFIVNTTTGILYNTYKEAATAVGLKSPSGIAMVCSGKRPKAQNYNWQLAKRIEL